MKYRIGIVLDLRRGLGKYLIDNLRIVLDDNIEYELFYMDQMTSMNHCDLVLVMIKEKILDILPYIDDQNKIITVKRTLTVEDVDNLRKLSSRDVLVVNDNEETTLNLVITLHKLGLNHINWVPYYNVEKIKTQTAITANESHLVPKDHEIIDIGFRPIDVSTIIEILQHLKLDLTSYTLKLQKYQSMYVSLDPKVLEQIEQDLATKKLHDVIMSSNKVSGHVSYYGFEDIITSSKVMLEMLEKAKKLAKHDINVLIVGESGTGKELIAQGIHQCSYRKDLPFVGVNVTAIPHNLLESELFGYVPGAFTGANKEGHKGLFEQCQGGTLFLDEIGDLPLELQGKLLRALEEQSIRPIGSKHIIKINVRIVAATNKNLLKEIEAGHFREDLYYRLKASILMIPPLRQREGDIKLLTKHFVDDGCFIEPDVFNVLLSYPFKGNVRELKHACEYAKIMSDGERITLKDLPDDLMVEEFLEPYFNRDKMFRVLESIQILSQSHASVGRKVILDHLNNEIGEGELKSILKHLKSEMMIIQGRGRKGSVLTKKGETFLSDYIQ